MKRSAITVGVAVVLSLLLIPLNYRPHHESRQYSESSLTPQQELYIKQTLVDTDVEQTNALCRNQCKLDFAQALGQIGGSDGRSGQAAAESVASVLSRMRTEHSHMERVVWARKGEALAQGVAAGTAAPGLLAKADADLRQAKQAVDEGRDFESAPIAYEQDTYFVLGVPADDRQSSLVGIVHQDILRHVRSHQTKNLRIVPYPADNNWKIESVDSNTLQDVKVDHPEQNEGTSHYHKNEVVVKFKTPPSEQQLKQIQAEIGATSFRKLGYTYVFQSAHMEAKQLMHYFQTNQQVEYAEPHFLYITNSRFTVRGETGAETSPPSEQAGAPNDVLYAKYQWNLPLIETVTGWNVGKGSKDVIVGVVDTGVDLTHPDLQGHVLPGLNVVNDSAAPDDDVGHGTHVAGVVSALVNNREGVAGMTWYNPILPVKVLDESGAGNTYAVAQGIIWAADNGAKVINLSLGNYAEASFLHDAIKYAFDKDVVLVAASGNDNTETPGYPAAYPEVLAVAAIDENKRKAAFSNYGDYIDVAAPGVSIASTYPHNQYAALSGTSMASPHVAALAALVRSVNPQLKNTEVMDILRQTATDLGPAGRDNYFGYGQIDVVKALERAGASSVDSRSADGWAQWLQRIVGK